ncbi:hypothetical protein FQN50_005769 [Emmonsiellopsis sp. PD_5]|nr:hypothetical protein FQN50_005769 [Emmonsiellopsis sp. PD_5]
MLAKSSLLFLSLTSSVLGHGYVREYTIDGANYVSYLPYEDPDFTQPPEGIARFHGNGINPSGIFPDTRSEEHGIIEYNSTRGRAWATQKMFDADKTWNITIPSCLAPGPYVIRHETMAIQASDELGGAQFYPQCAQVWVSGGTDVIEPALVSLPGDIQPDDPGVLFDRAAAMESGNYTCP